MSRPDYYVRCATHEWPGVRCQAHAFERAKRYADSISTILIMYSIDRSIGKRYRSDGLSLDQV